MTSDETPSPTGIDPQPEPRPGATSASAGTASGESGGTPLLQPVDEAARHLARMLLRSAREGALGVLRPGDGFPAVSRTLLATDFSGRPIILVSALSLHARALAADPRCSLLVARSGKGDPLAHPRMTIFAEAVPIAPGDDAALADRGGGDAALADRGGDDAALADPGGGDAALADPGGGDAAAVRERFLSRHPKAKLYVDFPDFRFLRLMPLGASLNGGFARAFELGATDIVDAPAGDLAAGAIRARDHMNEDHADAIDTLAAMHGEDGTGWQIVTVDVRGFEIARGDRLARIEFGTSPTGEGGYRKAFVHLLRPPQPDIGAAG